MFARIFSRLASAAEQHGWAEIRQRLLAEASGRVIEIGAGTGANFGHYPAAVSQVLAVEPEPHFRRLAERAAEHAPLAVSVVDGVAEALPAGDDEFDTAVVTLVLCSVSDLMGALREVRRVLRPGGRLIFWEHVCGEGLPLRVVQDALDKTVWPLLGGGCQVGRDTSAAITAAGFSVERMDRRRMPDTRIPLPMAPHIIGIARSGVPAPASAGGQ